MKKDIKGQEDISSLNLSIPLQHSNDIDIFPCNYYYEFIYTNNIQVTNIYSNSMEYIQEESHLNL